MGQWIADKIEFSDHADPDILRRLWLLMGLTDEWVTLFVDLHIRWENGRLCVAEKWRALPTTPEAVTTCLMHVWAFRSFSDSRWCSLGAGCRSLVSSLMVGLADLVRIIILNPRCSNYYIGGFSNLSKDVIRMCTLIACSGHISDSILLMVMEDDRIPKNIDRIDADLNSELLYVSSVEDGVLDMVSAATDIPRRILRDEVVQAAAVQAGYLLRRLRPARLPPWTLLAGDVKQNLGRLSEGELPEEPTTAKIYQLLSMGMSIARLEPAVNLLGELGWSTKGTEQGHAAASSIMKQHGQYSSHTMQSRSLLVQAQPLFQDDPDVKAIARLTSRMERLSRRQPQRITGRHMLVKALSGIAKDKQARGGVVSQDTGRRVIKNHMKVWSKFSALEQAGFQQQAGLLRGEREEEISSKMSDTRAEISSRRHRLANNKVDNQKLSLAACRLTVHQRREFDQLCETGDFNPARVARLREVAAQPVYPPPTRVREILESMPVPEAFRVQESRSSVGALDVYQS
jgi:hypothetical protein